ERFIEKFMFSNRKLILLILSVVFAFLATEAIQVKPEASFSKMVPGDHEFINNYKAYQSELADLGNVIRVIVETEEGDIFTQEFQQTLRQVTDDVFFIPGINRNALKSLWTPTVRWQEVTEEGFVGGAVVPDGYDGSDSMLEQLKTNVFKSGQVGVLVGNDFKSAIVLAPLQETNPETGLPLDYRELSERLERDIRDKYNNDTINIRIVGFAKVVGDLIEGAVQVVIFFALAVIITFVLLLLYSRCVRSTIVVLVFSILAVVSQLGILNLLGFGVNPYSMLVPFLVFAIGVSHGVQIITAIIQHVKTGDDKFTAAKLAFRSLYLAGITALVSDAIGFTTLMVIDIGVIRELAIAASIGVAVIIITNLVALPIVISFIGVSAGGRERHSTSAELARATSSNKLSTSIAGFAQPQKAKYALAVAVLFSVLGLYYSQFLKIGDLDAGAPELRADSRYNMDNAYVVANYSTSTDVFVVMAKTTPDTCITYNNLTWIDKLQWELKNVKGVQDVKSVANVSKFGMFGMNEGSLKWYGLNRNQFMTNASVARTPPGLINQDCSMVPILVFLDDHKADTLEDVVATVEQFKQQNNSGDVEFLLAAGNAGIEAVTNMVIEEAQIEMLIWVYSVVIALCLITFRSVRTVIAIILPLMLTSLLSQALMAYLGIGVKVATLPVIALGVGIGVDYGIYIFSKINEALAQQKSLYGSYLFALNQTGKAVAFTGLTLAIGVATWVFSPIKFQADMGLLLTFMFILNMVGALTLIPALAWLLRIGGRKGNDATNTTQEMDRV
ncbi:MAG: RND family transporter, partial [Cellvibrionales bacterium]|nr:RND family transporter [Cellvibrionales bacterium]